MRNLRRFYYNNKTKIWKVLLIITFVLGSIYLLDSNALQRKNKKINIEDENEKISNNPNAQTYISQQSAITGEDINKNEIKKVNETISIFLEYCKSSKIEEAYDMISNDCKQKEYKTIEEFQEKYVKRKITKDDMCVIEKWMSNTYKVSIFTNPLSTGEINTNKKIDYITIVNEDSKQKLNINGYIGKSEINKEKIQNNIKITVLEKEIYMDYEIYKFKIKNLSDKTIKIDSLENVGTMYIQDIDYLKYNAYAHEIFEEDLEIKPEREMEISIKYANTYSDRVYINKIVFNDIILDYIKYSKQENSGEQAKIEVDL